MRISRIISTILFISLLISCFVLISCNVTESHIDYSTYTTTTQNSSSKNSASVENTYNLGVVDDFRCLFCRSFFGFVK